MKANVVFIIAAALILVSAALFVGVMAYNGWDFTKLSTDKLVTTTHTPTEVFSNIQINISTTDITLLPSEDGSTKVVCSEHAYEQHQVSVADDTLTIRNISKKKWYHHIGIQFTSPKITLYLPLQEYSQLAIEGSTSDVTVSADFQFETMDIHMTTGDVTVKAATTGDMTVQVTTGDICLINSSAANTKLTAGTGDITVTSCACAGNLTTRVSTGDVAFTDVTATTITSTGTTGDLSMVNVIATEKFSFERSTGDITMTRCDAGEIRIKVTTGDVIGSLCSEKIFHVTASTGDVDVPKTTTGGTCDITTSTGDVKITVN